MTFAQCIAVIIMLVLAGAIGMQWGVDWEVGQQKKREQLLAQKPEPFVWPVSEPAVRKKRGAK